MHSPEALSQAFKLKAAALRDVVSPYLPGDLRMGMMLLEAMTPEAMTAAFNDHVAVPYSDRIRARDAAFFMTDDALSADPTLVALKAAWTKLPPQGKEDVWALLPLLCGISKRYAAASSA